MRSRRYNHRLVRAGTALRRVAITMRDLPVNAIPDAVRSEILRLDMHDVPVAEIMRQTGVRRSTVSAIIARTRGWTKERWRGDVVVLYDPAGTFSPGARFNYPDLNAMARLSGLADGTLFEVARRNGSTYRVEVRGEKLVRMEVVPV